MKYGRYEFERTFIVSNDLVQEGVSEVKLITDTYLHGIGLRLRKVEQKGRAQYKLTQKQEEEPVRKGVKRINTIYLSGEGYDKLFKLPGYRIEKTRHILEINQRRVGVDLIKYGGQEMWIAEAEFETEAEMNAFIVPFSYLKEVTNDPGYSGFSIAREYGKAD